FQRFLCSPERKVMAAARLRRHRVALGVTAASILAVAAAGGWAVLTPSTSEGHPVASDPAPAVPAQSIHSLTGSGLNSNQATHKLAMRRKTATPAAHIADTLGDRNAGSYVDKYSEAVVNVLDSAAADRVRAAGAQPKIVRHSMTELASIQQALKALPATPNS